MTSSASAQQIAGDDRAGPCPDDSRQLLADLEQAHALMLERIAEMDRITAGPAAGTYEFATARFRLSQAGFVKRQLVDRIRQYLLAGASQDEAASLGALAEQHFDLLRFSARHLGRWSATAIGADWNGYCAATVEIRHHMLKGIESERAVLCPMLERRHGR